MNLLNLIEFLISSPDITVTNLAQVQDYELQQQLLLKGSAHPLISRGLATASGSRLQAGVGGASGTKAPPTAPARLGLASTSQSTRVSTPTGTRLYVSRFSKIRFFDFINPKSKNILLYITVDLEILV